MYVLQYKKQQTTTTFQQYDFEISIKKMEISSALLKTIISSIKSNHLYKINHYSAETILIHRKRNMHKKESVYLTISDVLYHSFLAITIV